MRGDDHGNQRARMLTAVDGPYAQPAQHPSDERVCGVRPGEPPKRSPEQDNCDRHSGTGCCAPVPTSVRTPLPPTGRTRDLRLASAIAPSAPIDSHASKVIGPNSARMLSKIAENATTATTAPKAASAVDVQPRRIAPAASTSAEMRGARNNAPPTI